MVASEILPPRQQPESEYDQIAYDVDRGTGIMLAELLKERDTYKEQRNLLYPLLAELKFALLHMVGPEAQKRVAAAIAKIEEKK